MKKNFKRAMAAVMAAALTLSLAGNAAEADAAKKPKLAKKSVTVTVKQSKTVKIKNVKAKNVKKLSVKSANKKIVTVKKKGKTAVTVTGKKANKSAVKVTVSVTLKGKKKATKLTLKVKVTAKKPTTTPAPNVPGPSANVPAPSAAVNTDAPGTETTAPTVKPTKEPTAKPTPWAPDDDVKKELKDITLNYDHQFTAAQKVLFKDGEGYPAADSLEGGKKGGIDVRYYNKVIVTYTSDREISEGEDDNGSWGGKATLNNQDESEYGDGFYRRYLNDLKFIKESEDKENGSYAIEYEIQELVSNTHPGGLLDSWDFDDVSLVDCVSVQLNTNVHPYVDEVDEEGNPVEGGKKGVNFRLKKIEFKKDGGDTPKVTDAPGQTDAPGTQTTAPGTQTTAPGTQTSAPGTQTTAPTAEPTPAPVTLKVGDSNEIYEEDTAEITVSGLPAGVASIKSANLTSSDTNVATVTGTTVTGVAKGTTTISGTVTVTMDGKDVVINANPLTLKVTEKGTPIATVTVDTQSVEMVVTETADITSVVTVKVNNVDVNDAAIAYTWSADNNKVKVIDNGDGTASVVGLAAGDAVVTVKVIATKDSKPSAEKTATIAVTVYDKLTVETDTIEFAKEEIAINESVAFKNFTTNGTVDVESIKWAIVDTASQEIATVDAKGTVTGKKTGTAKIQATVKVTKGGGQEETVVITGTITVNKNKRVLLTNDNMAGQGNLLSPSYEGFGRGIENGDGTMTIYTNAQSGGGGIQFFVDSESQQPVDLSDYKEIRITASDDSDETRQACINIITGNATSYWSSETKSGLGPQYPFFGREAATTHSFDLTKATNKTIQAILVKSNAQPTVDSSWYKNPEQPWNGVKEEYQAEYTELQAACKAKFTIYSIELIANDAE